MWLQAGETAAAEWKKVAKVGADNPLNRGATISLPNVRLLSPGPIRESKLAAGCTGARCSYLAGSNPTTNISVFVPGEHAQHPLRSRVTKQQVQVVVLLPLLLLLQSFPSSLPFVWGLSRRRFTTQLIWIDWSKVQCELPTYQRNEWPMFAVVVSLLFSSSLLPAHHNDNDAIVSPAGYENKLRS